MLFVEICWGWTCLNHSKFRQSRHRWARLLEPKMSITIYCLPIKENKHIHICLYINIYIYTYMVHIRIYRYTYLHVYIYAHIHIYTMCAVTPYSKTNFTQIFWITSLFHNSKSSEWFLMIGKGSSLRNHRFCCRQQQQPSPTAACTCGTFTEILPDFGVPLLPNSFIPRADFLVSCSVALRLQYAFGAVIQRV